MNLKNILQSGYDFNSGEYELKLKYVLFNSLLIFNIAMVSIALVIRLINFQFTNALLNIIYLIFALLSLYFARKSKNHFKFLIYFVLFFSYLIVSLAFHSGLNPIAGISWYTILLMSAFFLKQNRDGIIIFILSLLTIIIIVVNKNIYSPTEIALGIIPLFASLMFMIFFEKRNEDFKIQLEAQKEEYLHQAQYDDLTGIANRALFMDRLNHALVVAKRSNDKVAVIFIDLDHFKEINDSLGHHIGDLVLREVAQRLKTHTRESDTIARLGGDEYAIILNSFGTVDRIKNIITKLIDAMKIPIIVDNEELNITFSLGVTIYPDDGLQTDILLKNADTAMYRAKADGKNRYFFYEKGL